MAWEGVGGSGVRSEAKESSWGGGGGDGDGHVYDSGYEEGGRRGIASVGASGVFGLGIENALGNQLGKEHTSFDSL